MAWLMLIKGIRLDAAREIVLSIRGLVTKVVADVLSKVAGDIDHDFYHQPSHASSRACTTSIQVLDFGFRNTENIHCNVGISKLHPDQ